MIRIAFDVDHGGFHVFGLVPERVNDDATRDRAVGADAAGFGGARDLELAHFGARAAQVEAQHARATNCRGDDLEEGTALHRAPPSGGEQRRLCARPYLIARAGPCASKEWGGPRPRAGGP